MCYNVSDAVSVAVSRGLGVKEDSSRATRIQLDMIEKSGADSTYRYVIRPQFSMAPCD